MEPFSFSGSCLFCAVCFKSLGALFNHLSNVHPGKQLPRKPLKCKRPPSETDSDQEENIPEAGLPSFLLMAEDLRRIFFSYPVSELETLSARVIQHEYRQLMSYEVVGDNITALDGQK